MNIVTDGRVSIFVSEKLGRLFYPPFRCVGIEKDGEVIGGAVFNCFEGKDIQVTVAGKGWNPTFLKRVGTYVYGQLGCERITVKTEQERVVEIAKKLGGQVEGRLRNHFGPGRDAIIVGILKADYKFQEN